MLKHMFLALIVAGRAFSCGEPGSPMNGCPKLQPDEAWTEIHGNGVYTTAQRQDAEKRAARIARDFDERHFVAMADHTNLALRALIKIGYLNLRRNGYRAEAEKLRAGWQKFDGELVRIVSNPNRDIGDFEPLSAYLAMAYEVLEYKIGYKLCYILRLTDIKTLNFGIPVVFSPCKHTLNDFCEHFIHDEKYRGVAPVVTYWVTVITCSIATYGAGYFFICSPIGMLTELTMDKAVAPWLAPKIYNWACGGQYAEMASYRY